MLISLINEAIHGKRKSQKRLYELFAPYLFTVARRYNNSSLDSLDLLQEAFIEIFKDLKKYDASKGQFKNWCTTITIRTALRLNSKRPKEVLITESHLNLSDKTYGPIEQMSEEHLLHLIDQLPDKYKAVFNMAVIDGYTHKQISQELGIKESTSRSLLKRAREKITRRIIAVKIKEGIR